jgi:tryptophanyl-tRNA synthetase
MHKAFSPPDVIEKVDRECRTAGIGCVECKRLLFEHMMAELKPIQERAKALFAEPGAVSQTLLEGAQKAKKIAAGVMKEVLNATGIR